MLDSQAAAAAIAASRLLSCGLVRIQKATFLYLSVNVVSCFLLSLFGPQSKGYFYCYVACEAVTDIMAAAVVRELFAISVSNYPGIKTASKWVVYAAVISSGVFAILLTFLTWRTGRPEILYYILTFRRSLQYSLVIVVLALLFLVARFPLDLRRNIYISCYFFSAVFLLDASDTLVATLTPRLFYSAVDLTGAALIAVCFLAWAALLQREAIAPQRIVFRTPHEDELLHQLESLNQTLSRIGRR